MSVKLVVQWIRINVTLKWTAQSEKDQSKQRNGAQLYFTLLFTKIFLNDIRFQNASSKNNFGITMPHSYYMYLCMYAFVCLFIHLFT